MDAPDLVNAVKEGDRRALARAITYVENGGTSGLAILDELDFFLPDSHVIGITGPPGSGKSTLVDHLIDRYRQQGSQVAVLAVDPTSPYSGGAILGDRIRMLSKTSDDGVYIRSLASRGRLGGLSPHTFDVLLLMQHAGFDKIIVETVGAGQSEIDIVRNADTTVVLSVPGLGDDIQVIKAGIMEIADLFVVNKADLSGSEQVRLQIKNMLDLVPHKTTWTPPIVETSALRKEGIEELLEAIHSHFSYLQEEDRLKQLRLDQLSFELRNKFHRHLGEILDQIEPDPIEAAISKLIEGRTTLSDSLQMIQTQVFSTQTNN